MFDLGSAEILMMLVIAIPRLLMFVGAVLGFIAFLKVRRIESSLRSRGIL